MIVPVGPGERLWKALLNDLYTLPREAEVIIVSPEPFSKEELKEYQDKLLAKVRYIHIKEGSRASHLNEGAYQAQNQFLWFVHADTTIPRQAFVALARSLSSYPQDLHYFDLQFFDGPKKMFINSMVANLRSRYLRVPLGDQAICISKKQFERIGGFNEETTSGEDHSFCWEAKKKGIRITPVKASIFTSARRYINEGWGKLTAERMMMTAKSTLIFGTKHLINQKVRRIR